MSQQPRPLGPKVVHLNTSVNRSSAPYKLHKAMKEQGIDSNILAMQASGVDDVNIVKRPLLYKVKRKIYTYKRRNIKGKLQLQEYMPIDILPMGMDISKHPLIKEADVICIHWTNGDFFSTKEIKKLINMGKQIYQFCHDNYTFTGGCHVRMGCEGHKSGCKDCPQIRDKNANTAIAKKIIEKAIDDKKACYEADNVTIVSPSNWMDKNVSQSHVLNGCRHIVQPNIVDMKLYKPASKEIVAESRKKYGLIKEDYVILCAVKSDERIPYNGMKYLWSSLEEIKKKHSDIKILIFGTEELSNNHKVEYINAGYIKGVEELVNIYSLANVFLITSLEDSFNQTAAESISCGTPVVAFNNGGIADIIEHKENGFLAELENKEQLITGIEFFLYNREKCNSDKIRNTISGKFVLKDFYNN